MKVQAIVIVTDANGRDTIVSYDEEHFAGLIPRQIANVAMEAARRAWSNVTPPRAD